MLDTRQDMTKRYQRHIHVIRNKKLSNGVMEKREYPY